MSTKSGDSQSKTSDLDLLARLEALEARAKSDAATIEQLKSENERITNSGGLRFSPKDQPFVGDGGGYEFLVTPHINEADPKQAHLKPVKVRCCDESEAIRWYCQSHEMTLGSGRAVDPVKLRITAEIQGRERADSVMRQKQVSVLRKKIEGGQALSDSDKTLLSEVEDEIYGFGS